MFEIVYDDDDDGRTDGRRLDRYTISSPCEPNGSGELMIAVECFKQKYFQGVSKAKGLSESITTVREYNNKRIAREYYSSK